MPNSPARYVILLGMLVLGQGLLTTLAGESEPPTARWPSADSLYTVERWTVSSETVDSPYHGVQFVRRDYHGPDDLQAILDIRTHSQAKSVYAAGVDVPFLGAGYEVAAAPPDVVPPSAGREARIVQSERGRWLLLYAYGERRGRLGNGPWAWATALLDATFRQSNDYYQVRLLVARDPGEPHVVDEAVGLADTLFARVAAWYGTPPS